MLSRVILLLSVVVAVALIAVGVDYDRQNFIPGVLSSMVAVLFGVPLAVWLVVRQRVEAETAATRERESELSRLRRAGQAEADRVIGMAKDVVQAVEGDRPISPLDAIVGYWSELLGPKFYSLTASDDALHELRHAHSRLERAVNSLRAAEERSPPDDPDRLFAEAAMNARTAIRFAEMARRTLEGATLITESEDT